MEVLTGYRSYGCLYVKTICFIDAIRLPHSRVSRGIAFLSDSCNYRLDIDWQSSFFNAAIIEQDGQLSQSDEVLEYLADPLRVASEALKHMIMDCGWKQPDTEVCWRHVAQR